MNDDHDDRSIGESLRKIDENIESMERTFWRYGLPAVILAWFTVGMVAGVSIGVFVL